MFPRLTAPPTVPTTTDGPDAMSGSGKGLTIRYDTTIRMNEVRERAGGEEVTCNATVGDHAGILGSTCIAAASRQLSCGIPAAFMCHPKGCLASQTDLVLTLQEAEEKSRTG